MSWRRVKAEVVFSLPPSMFHRCSSYLDDVVLSPTVLRYSREARGVVATHRVLEVFTDSAVISGVSPYLHVTARVELLVFSPPKGAFLPGVVTYVDAEFLGLKVYGSIYAVIARKEAPRGFVMMTTPMTTPTTTGGKGRHVSGPGAEWERVSVARGTRSGDEEEENEMGEERQPIPVGTKIRQGTQVRFLCLALLHTRSGLFQIKGSLQGLGCRVVDARGPSKKTTSRPHSFATKAELDTTVKSEAMVVDEEEEDDLLLSVGGLFGDPLAELELKHEQETHKADADEEEAELGRRQPDPSSRKRQAEQSSEEDDDADGRHAKRERKEKKEKKKRKRSRQQSE